MLKAKVQHTEGDSEAEVFTFEKPTIMIGRAEGNDIRLDAASGVSRYHARVDIDGQDLVIQDLGSTNGTYVNASRIEKTSISESDKVVIGEVLLTFSLIEDEDEEQAVFDEVTIKSENVSDSANDGSTVEVEEVSKKAHTTQHSKKEEILDFYWKSLRNFLGPIWEYIEDDAVSEIMINSPDEVYVEKKGYLSKTDAFFTEAELKAAVLNIAQFVGRRVSEQEPYLDARLPDGSRVAILLPPCSRKGISVAIRKFSNEALTLDRLIGFGSLSEEIVCFLRACVVLRKNILISGGTSSGKTSLLNVISGLIPGNERIITIEDAAELQLKQEHILPMETRPPDKKGRGQVTIRDLVKTSLRMRPDRIIVGEIRGGEALDLLQAMNTGHSGSMTTVHASSPPQALTRLETLALFSGLEIPVRALRDQISSAIDIVVQASRLPDHSRKVTHISEVRKCAADGEYNVVDIFTFQRGSRTGEEISGSHVWTGAAPMWIEEMELAGLDDALQLFQGATVKEGN